MLGAEVGSKRSSTTTQENRNIITGVTDLMAQAGMCVYYIMHII